MISLSAAGAGFPGSPATSGGVTATSQPADEGRVGLDEIVVTAQKRAQNIQDVPITVSAFSGAELQERGVTQVSQLTNYTPNVQLTSTARCLSGAEQSDHSLSAWAQQVEIQ